MYEKIKKNEIIDLGKQSFVSPNLKKTNVHTGITYNNKVKGKDGTKPIRSNHDHIGCSPQQYKQAPNAISEVLTECKECSLTIISFYILLTISR